MSTLRLDKVVVAISFTLCFIKVYIQVVVCMIMRSVLHNDNTVTPLLSDSQERPPSLIRP